MNPVLNHIRTSLLQIESAIQKELIGQNDLIRKMIITFFAGGHALIEGVPGLGKTKAVRIFSKVIGLSTGRVSFTPDLLPTDLTGNEIYRPGKGVFEIRKGPIFTHILLADEINRTPPKVQSALLEAMEEKRVTLGDSTLDLPSPFIVFATQNPLEHAGTYPLPEAQLDRFFMKIILDYPSSEDEKVIFASETTEKMEENSTETKIESYSKDDLIEMMQYIGNTITIDEKIYTYIGRILSGLRLLTKPGIKNTSPILDYAPSTRAGLALIRAAKIWALLEGRDFVLPDDIKSLAHGILDHRMGISYDASIDGISPLILTDRILHETPIE